MKLYSLIPFFLVALALTGLIVFAQGRGGGGQQVCPPKCLPCDDSPEGWCNCLKEYKGYCVQITYWGETQPFQCNFVRVYPDLECECVEGCSFYCMTYQYQDSFQVYPDSITKIQEGQCPVW